jgi:hypothetical protein
LDIGAQLGGRTATAGNIGGQLLSAGGLKAAATMQPANALNPLASGLSGLSQSPLGTAADAYLGKKLGNWWDSASYGFTPQGAYGQQDQYMAGVNSNPRTQQEEMLAAQMSGFGN